MWRHVLYLVGTIGAAFLAAWLIVLVVEPRVAGPALTGRLRQISALVSLGLVGSSGYIMFRWVQYTLAAWGRLDR